MPKEKSINPAQAQRKAEKAKAVKKGKAEAAARRTEKLARRNPERLQKQLDDLKALSASGAKLTTHEQRVLEELERDVKAVRKARETLGDKAPVFGGRGAVLGKRRREGREWKEEEGSGDSDVPEEVRRVPMPRDTPPPIPKEVLDRWYQARRERYAVAQVERRELEGAGAGRGANVIPLGENARVLPPRPVGAAGGVPSPTPPVEVKTVYEAAPVIRDLRKEAVSFVPAAVRMKMDKSKGKGGLMEAEEADELERAGYLGTKMRAQPLQEPEEPKRDHRAVTMEEAEDEEY